MRLTTIAMAALAVLMAVSLAFPLLPFVLRSSGAPGNTVVPPPGTVLAIVKVVALAFVFQRVRRADNYTLQWSSMFILLFLAEGIVRAMTDRSAGAVFGGMQVAATIVYFAATLAILRPLKKDARAVDRR